MSSDPLTYLLEVSPTRVQVLTRSGRVIDDLQGPDALERAEAQRALIEAGLRGGSSEAA